MTAKSCFMFSSTVIALRNVGRFEGHPLRRRVSVVRVEPVHVESEYSLFRLGPILSGTFHRNAQVEDIERIWAASEVARGEVGRFGNLTILRGPLGLGIPADVRKRSEQLANEFSTATFGSAVVIEEGGMRAAILRSAITGISLASRKPSPTRSFATIAEACEWLANLAEEPVDLAALIHNATRQAERDLA